MNNQFVEYILHFINKNDEHESTVVVGLNKPDVERLARSYCRSVNGRFDRLETIEGEQEGKS